VGLKALFSFLLSITYEAGLLLAAVKR